MNLYVLKNAGKIQKTQIFYGGDFNWICILRSFQRIDAQNCRNFPFYEELRNFLVCSFQVQVRARLVIISFFASPVIYGKPVWKRKKQ